MWICTASWRGGPHAPAGLREVNAVDLADLGSEVCGRAAGDLVHADPEDTDVHAAHPVTSGRWCTAYANTMNRPLPQRQLTTVRSLVTCAACLHALVRADRSADWSPRLNVDRGMGELMWDRRLAGRWFRFVLSWDMLPSGKVIARLAVLARVPVMIGPWVVVRTVSSHR